MSKVAAQALSITYQNQRTRRTICALAGVNFTVQDGQFVAIVGPSGCGKSTLLAVIAGLQSATQGQLVRNSQPITGPGADWAMGFQAPALLPWRTVRGNVAYGLELQRKQITYFHPPSMLFRQWLDTLAPNEFYPHLRYVLPSEGGHPCSKNRRAGGMETAKRHQSWLNRGGFGPIHLRSANERISMQQQLMHVSYQAILDQCYHPTGFWAEFPAAAVERSIQC